MPQRQNKKRMQFPFEPPLYAELFGNRCNNINAEIKSRCLYDAYYHKSDPRVTGKDRHENNEIKHFVPLFLI
jgi:hypothetical protein